MINEHYGLARITQERVRQVNEKGWTLEHDRTQHPDRSLLDAAVALILVRQGRPNAARSIIQSSADWVGPFVLHAAQKYADDPIRLLDIAGALVAAEIDRSYPEGT